MTSPVSSLTLGLLVTTVVGVLLLPFLWPSVERHLEAFLLGMGVLAVTVSESWSWALAGEAVRAPVGITMAVLVAGLLFHIGRPAIDRGVRVWRRRMSLRPQVFLVVVGLGLLASVVTAVIAALLLVEVVTLLGLDRRWERDLTILACFAIGLGAALTPLGEPLSTIVTANLHQDFWYLGRLLGGYLIPGILGIGVVAAWRMPRRSGRPLRDTRRREPLAAVGWRTLRVYAFVAALVLLGAGLLPLVERYVAPLSAALLFWVNMVSAILDNATLAAAEVGPAMSRDQVTAVLLGLLISGGMLIPGNIPNIIAAGHLKIGSRAWARFGVPMGLILMTVCFGAWLAVRG